MTRPSVLLVTGSRAFEDGDKTSVVAANHAEALLDGFILRLRPGSVVVVGDCDRGPDRWARRSAETARRRLSVWRTDGSRHDARPGREADDPWSTRVEVWGEVKGDPRRDPLLRNAAMGVRAAELHRDGHEVFVLALRAAWSRTNGTAHTWRCARDAGLPGALMEFSQGGL